MFDFYGGQAIKNTKASYYDGQICVPSGVAWSRKRYKMSAGAGGNIPSTDDALNGGRSTNY